MNMLAAWAQRWNVPQAALDDLHAQLMTASETTRFEGLIEPATTEQGVQQRERMSASNKGGRLWRNNVGAFETETGAWVRYGLCNESKAINKRVKSSDLIGIMPVVVTQEHVGSVIGRFTAREIKRPGWRFVGTEREVAQMHFLTLVNQLGGDGRFVS